MGRFSSFLPPFLLHPLLHSFRRLLLWALFGQPCLRGFAVTILHDEESVTDAISSAKRGHESAACLSPTPSGLGPCPDKVQQDACLPVQEGEGASNKPRVVGPQPAGCPVRNQTSSLAPVAKRPRLSNAGFRPTQMANDLPCRRSQVPQPNPRPCVPEPAAVDPNPSVGLDTSRTRAKQPTSAAGDIIREQGRFEGVPIHQLLFVELCTGSARLSKAVKRQGFGVLPIDNSKSPASGIHICLFDLTDPIQFESLMDLTPTENRSF